MCQYLNEVSSGGVTVGLYYELCSTPEEDLAQVLASDSRTVAKDDLRRSSVFKSCIASFSRATHLLVELDYFDMDFRSNAGHLVARKHQPANFRTDRLIFFSSVAGDQPAADVPDLFGRIDEANALGYMVLRPEPIGPVGRSIIPPPTKLSGVEAELPNAIRTAVHETIVVFGRHHEIVGVPFMQQDGHLFTCAHACAWMAHYSGVLRGLCARRSTVEFHTDQARTLLISRQYPAGGLTSWQVATLLEHFGLPAISLFLPELATDGRLAEWFDRETVWQLSAELAAMTNDHANSYRRRYAAVKDVASKADHELESDSDRTARKAAKKMLERLSMFWLRENITRMVCQYLNSGFPCIVISRFHSVVINGYLRARDMESPPQGVSPTDVVAFVVADDQAGPYVLHPLDQLIEDMTAEHSDAALLIPLAPGIWVAAKDAELVGARIFAAAVANGLEVLTDRPDDAVFHDTTGESDLAAPLSQLRHLIENPVRPEGRTGMTLRSYVVPSTDFKNGFSRRCKDDQVAVLQVRLAKLPRFVWVVELMDRAKRETGSPSVIGEVVLDASDLDVRDTKAAIVHIPGMIQVRNDQGPGKWHVTGAGALYESGRYHDTNDWMTSPDARTTRWKTALA